MPGKPTILCVDDEHAVLSTMQLILSSADYEVLTAATVPEAIALVKAYRVDLVLTDRFPERGLLVQEAKRANPETRVLIHSGDLGASVDAASEIPGVDGYMIKPVAPRELLQRVAELLQK